MSEQLSYERFSFAFEGENEIDASLLGISLSNLSYIVNKIADNEPVYEECKLRVTGFQKGSFEVLLTCVVLTAGQISALYSPSDIATFVNVLKGIFDVKKCLKGEKPKSISEDLNTGYMHVLSPDGSEAIAPLGSKIVISDPAVSQKVSELGQAVRLHNPTAGFRLTSGNGTTLYSSNDVEDIARSPERAEFLPNDSSNSMRVLLPIKKIDLLGNAAWSFKYGKRTITAKIEDAEFIKSVHNGKTSYKAGDSLDVLLIATTKLTSDGTPIKETYLIEKVYRHIPAAEQQKI